VKRTVSAFAAFASTFLLPSYTSANQLEHNIYRGELLVEHAEIVLPAPGAAAATGYLVIWNGTQKTANVTAIESGSFASISTRRTDFEGERAYAEPYEGILSVPGQAELIMRPDGVYLSLKDPAKEVSAGDIISLTVVFDDGQRLDAKATVLAPGAQLIDHHHAEADRFVNG
jgi:copper(I)-binding protein